MELSRRDLLRTSAAGAVAGGLQSRPARAQTESLAAIEREDRVFVVNADSSTITVIDPRSNTVDTTINLTSFDEDPRPPFRFVTASVAPTSASMFTRPLYHGAVALHGAALSADGRLLATCGSGSSNVYLIDTSTKSVVGNVRNPQAGPTTNAERITSGVLVGRDPHEAAFHPGGRELWVAVRGENRVVIAEVETAVQISRGAAGSLRYLPTLNGPSHVCFSGDGAFAFIASQKEPKVDVWELHPDPAGRSRPVRTTVVDMNPHDPLGATSFLKTSPDNVEIWLSHPLSDRVTVLGRDAPRVLDTVSLGAAAQPNQLEFVENTRGKVVYVSLVRVDEGGPGQAASSRIAIIDRAAKAGARKVFGMFPSRGRAAHGLWTNPTSTLLYIAHEQDELPGTPAGGETVVSAFDVSNPFAPAFIAQIPLGSLRLPSGELRSKRSTSLLYARPGWRSRNVPVSGPTG